MKNPNHVCIHMRTKPLRTVNTLEEALATRARWLLRKVVAVINESKGNRKRKMFQKPIQGTIEFWLESNPICTIFLV